MRRRRLPPEVVDVVAGVVLGADEAFVIHGSSVIGSESGIGSTQLSGMFLFGSLPKPRYLEVSNGVISLKKLTPAKGENGYTSQQ